MLIQEQGRGSVAQAYDHGRGNGQAVQIHCMLYRFTLEQNTRVQTAVIQRLFKVTPINNGRRDLQYTVQPNSDYSLLDHFIPTTNASLMHLRKSPNSLFSFNLVTHFSNTSDSIFGFTSTTL